MIYHKFHVDSVKVLERRGQYRALFIKHMQHPAYREIIGEVMIRDIRAFDQDRNEPKQGTFPKFKVDTKGLYSRGIEVTFGVTSRRITISLQGDYRFADSSDNVTEEGHLFARLCFDQIKHVEWTTEDDIPHIFCRHRIFRQHPYESIGVYTKLNNSEELMEVKNFRKRDLDELLNF